MAIAFVQQATGTALGSNSANITISAPAAGSALFLCMGGSHQDTVSSVTGGGVTWAQIIGSNVDLDSEIWAGFNSSGSGTTITVNLSGTNNHWFNVSEFSGVATSAAGDGTNVSHSVGSASTVTTGSITTTNANDLLIASSIETATYSTGPSSSFNAFSTPDSSRLNCGYQIVAATGTYSTSWTFTADLGNGYETTIAAFKDSGGSGFTAKFRKTLSQVGTGVGKRQSQ